MRWGFAGKGMLNYTPSIVAVSVKVLETPTCRSPSRHAASGRQVGARGDAMPQRRRLADAALLTELCRGQVEPAGEAPAINPRYLSEESDGRAIVGGLCFPRRMFAAPALKQFVREETLPGAQVRTDGELLEYARRNGGTCYHASCTCMMGSHAMAIVDNELRVRGLTQTR
jgi:choline dehydrogenase-like flavoprotein